MKTILKSMLLSVLSIFLVAGSAMAYPFIAVEGYVDPNAATITDNLDGTSDFDGLEYMFTVTDSVLGAEMDFLSLEFEPDVFLSVDNVQFLQPTDWWSFTDSSSSSVYELAFAGTSIGLGESLTFAVDVTMYNDALADPSLWQEGQVWAQSFLAGDSYCGGDGGSTSTSPVNEPATMLLLGSGLVVIAAFSRNKFFKR